MMLRTAGTVEPIPLDHPDLAAGWWAVERDSGAMRRWTDGDAGIRLPAIEPAVPEIELADSLRYPMRPEVAEFRTTLVA